LLSKGADPYLCGPEKSPPLNSAIKGNNKRAVQILLKKGVNPRFRDHWGLDAFAYAEEAQPEVRALVRGYRKK
jgi:hypothetical protein